MVNSALLIDLRTTDIPTEAHLAAGNPNLGAAIEQAFVESVGGCPPDHRVTRQQLTVEIGTPYRIQYTFSGKSYSAWWLDLPENPLLRPITTPLANAATDLVDEALRLWNEGQPRAAARTLQNAIEMAESDPRCREALDDRRADIPPELWGLADRVFSPTKVFRRAWKALKKNPALLIVLAVVSGAMLLGVASLAVAMLAGPKGSNPPTGAADPRRCVGPDPQAPTRGAIAAGP